MRTAAFALALFLLLWLWPFGLWYGGGVFSVLILIIAIAASIRSAPLGSASVTTNKAFRRLARARVLASSIVGALMICAGVPLIIWGADQSIRYMFASSTYTAEALGVLGIALWGASRPFSRWVRARLQRTESLVDGIDDVREPILLLRSFEDDRLEVPGNTMTDVALEVMSADPKARFEELVAWTLWRTGPVIAVGQSDQPSRPLGAARIYFGKDGDWKGGVERLAAEARIITFVVGRTRGLEWELSNILGQEFLAKAIFVIPPVAADAVWGRWAIFQSMLGLGPEADLDFGDTFPILVHFDRSGHPVVHVSVARTPDSYESALDQAVMLLRDQSEVRLSAPHQDLRGDSPDVELLRITPLRHEEGLGELLVGIGRSLGALAMILASGVGFPSDGAVRVAISLQTNSDAFTIQAATRRDLRRLRWIARRGVLPHTPSHWSSAARRAFGRRMLGMQAMRNHVDTVGHTVLLASTGGVPVGVAIVALPDPGVVAQTDRGTEPPSAELVLFGVHPELRHTLLAEQLIESALATADTAGCTGLWTAVWRASESSLLQLQQLGFASVGSRLARVDARSDEQVVLLRQD
jgi:GNAT superfamily N-acetyltransferase